MSFGGSYVCRTGLLSVLCHFDYPRTLPPALHLLDIGKVLRELAVAPLGSPDRLNGCGLILVLPRTLEGELSALLPALAQRLGRAGKDRNQGGFRLDWLAGERPLAAR